MKRFHHHTSSLCVTVSAFALSACAVVDQYSGRAIVYNMQAEQAQNQAVLLNIVRASLRRPMQFTTVSSIIGTASATGGVQSVLPTNIPFRPVTNGASIATFPALPTWTINGSMSGGPTFTTPVMDTQEFYQGILKPISGQTYDLYIHANYPRDLLFNLFVEKVVMTQRHEGQGCPTLARTKDSGVRDSKSPDTKPDNTCDCPHTNDCEFIFENHVTDDLEHRLFQALGDYLLQLGLTTEISPTRTVKFEHASNLNIRYVGAGQWNSTAQVVAPPASAPATGDAAPRSYGFCFAPREQRYTGCIGQAAVCLGKQQQFSEPQENPGVNHKVDQGIRPLSCDTGFPIPTDSPSTLAPAYYTRLARNVQANPKVVPTSQEKIPSSVISAAKVEAAASSPKIDIGISKDFAEYLQWIVKRHGSAQARDNVVSYLENFKGREVTLKFYLRSVDGMIYYIGGVVRRQLHPEPNASGSIFTKRESPYGQHETYMCTEPDKVCSYLFVLKDGRDSLGTPDFVSVEYEGSRYSIPDSLHLETGGNSSVVLDILRQQIALNSSAKSLPQSSVISVVGGGQ
jgi:hypothetical protein